MCHDLRPLKKLSIQVNLHIFLWTNLVFCSYIVFRIMVYFSSFDFKSNMMCGHNPFYDHPEIVNCLLKIKIRHLSNFY